MKCKVIMNFYDKTDHEKLKMIGDELEITEERFRELSAKKLVEEIKNPIPNKTPAKSKVE